MRIRPSRGVHGTVITAVDLLASTHVACSSAHDRTKRPPRRPRPVPDTAHGSTHSGNPDDHWPTRVTRNDITHPSLPIPDLATPPNDVRSVSNDKTCSSRQMQMSLLRQHPAINEHTADDDSLLGQITVL